MFERAILLLLLVKVFCVYAQTTLQQVHIVFRHGDRWPVNLYPNDPNEGYVWPNGPGQLSNVGKQQQFELGTFLRDRYKDFLTTSDPREIKVRSSDKDRCIASTQVNLAAFYKPNGQWVWNDQLNWQPVPIHTVPGAEDGLLNEDAICPAADAASDQAKNDMASTAYTNKYQEMFTYVSHHSGMTVNDPMSVLDVFGTIFIEKLKNLTIPSWVDPIYDQLSAAANDAFNVRFSSKKVRRLRGGPLVGQMTSLMQQKTAQTLSSSEKAYMYSTHDAIISAVLSAMGVFNGVTVPYCATILTELHNINEANVVRLYYRNTTQVPPHQLVIPGCAADCPIDQFAQKMQDIIPTNWKEECRIGGGEKDDRFKQVCRELVKICSFPVVPKAVCKKIVHNCQ